MTNAVTMGDKGFQHLDVQPADLVSEDGLADRGEGELAAHPAYGFVIGGAQGW